MPSKMNVPKKYCKVCHDSGKNEEEYTSHYTRENRDPKSNVTCPILKALECRYCCKSGHTVKYCPILKNKNNNNFKKNNKEVLKKEEKKMPELTNKFACLIDDSDDEDENEKVIQKNVCSMNYAAALKTETDKKQVPEVKMVEAVCLSEKKELPRRRILDWAAECDTDSDEE